MSKSYCLEQINTQWQAVDKATLLFVVQNGKVLLIRKKRGLGAGKINGPGGKLDPFETAHQCAIREVQEELCISVNDALDVGRLRFQFIDAYSIDVQVFVATQFTGTPTETDEAIPLWFALDDVPYDEMWADDCIWLPRILAATDKLGGEQLGERIDGRFIFDGDRLLEHDVVILA